MDAIDRFEDSLSEIREKRANMLTLSELITELASLPSNIRNVNTYEKNEVSGKNKVEKLIERYHHVKGMIDGFYEKKIKGY